MTNSERNPEEDGLVAEAMISFFMTFADYVKENDPELWRRAKDFAVDLSPLPKGVKIVDETK